MTNNVTEMKKPQDKKPRIDRNAATSKTVILRQIELQTETAQKVYERNFKYFAQAAYTIELVAPIVCTEQQADIANMEIESVLKDMLAEMKGEINRLDHQLKEACIDENGSKGKAAKTYDVELDSQYAGQYLRSIQLLDKIILKIDVLWINGEYDRKQRGAGTFQWKQRIGKISGRAREVAKVLQSVMYRKSKEPIKPFAHTLKIIKAGGNNKPMAETIEPHVAEA